jgi:hypothetical protein
MKTERKRPGAPKGSQNASKGGYDAHLNIRLQSELKGALKEAAGGKLTDFVLQACKNEVLRTQPDIVARYRGLFVEEREPEPEPELPRWARALSVRTANCLIAAGFTSKQGVRKATAEGFDFLRLMNFGPRCQRELDEWLAK